MIQAPIHETAPKQQAGTNFPPSFKWVAHIMACGIRRQRLHMDGKETPFFIDSARGVRAHRSYGEEHGLWGSGLGSIPPGCKYRIAAPFGCGRKIELLKHRAEQLAVEYTARSNGVA